MTSATPGRRDDGRALDIVLVLATVALAVQLAAQWDLGAWIIDQGRDVLWAESISSGQQLPRLGPAASGVQLQGPAYYLWMGALRYLGIAGWWVGAVLVMAWLAQAALLARAQARHALPRSVVLAVGLGLGHVGLATLLLTPMNPSWIPLIGAAALAVLAGAERASTGPRAALRYSVAGCLWIVAIQFHVSALVAAPALAVATFLAPRRLRVWATAGLVVGTGLAFVTIGGGPAVAMGFVKGLLAQQAGAAAPSLAVRLAEWLVMPWRLAGWWRRNGVLGAFGAAGAIAQWAAVLAGIALAVVAARRAGGARRVWLVVLLTWAAGGLVYPVPVRTTAFYYLVGALPALYLAAGSGLAQRRWSAWLGAAVLVAANIGALEFGRSLAREGEWRIPSFALWWSSSTLRLPTLRSVRETVDLLAERGYTFGCAVEQVRGGPWVAAMMDGGVLASRLLPVAGRPCPAPVYVIRQGGGALRLLALPAGTGASWTPAPVALREPTEMPLPALRPFAGEIGVPGDGLARLVTVLAIDRPPLVDCGAAWEPFGLGRFQLRLAGDTPCRLIGGGEPTWVDISPSP